MPNKWRYFAVVVILALLWFAGGVPAAQAVAGPDVPPVVVAGNPNCADLGYAYGFKPFPEPPPSGTYAFPDSINSLTINSNGTYFSWTSTLGIDAVIVKGGSNANVFKYDPPAESFGDDGLVSPNNSSGGPAAISHIEFCYDYELTASKTANAQFTRTYTWSIQKDAAPTLHVGFAGENFSSAYEVVVDQTVADTDFAVAGAITVNNPTPFSVSFSVSDLVAGSPATVSCPTNTLAAGASTTCTYSASLPAKADGTNTATITSNTAGVGGATASANYAFGDPTTTVGDPTVNVNDSVQGSLGSASGDQTFEYSDDFVCPSDSAVYTNGVFTDLFPNTATIVETGQSDGAAVHLECYAPVVTKTASTSLTRSWTWTIAKTGDQTGLLLAVGQSFVVNYDVVVDAASADSNFAAAGVISVYNPADEAMTVRVADVLPGATGLTVDCGDASPSLTIAPKSTGVCSYSAGLPDGLTRTNTATATINGASFSGTAEVNFAGATVNHVDECIDVTDDRAGALGAVCANELPKTFEYALNVGPYDACGAYTYANTASFVTNDSGASGSSTWTIPVNVPCDTGCTLTQGYWKTHSKYGPAPYDDTWAAGSFNEDTLFFLSGQSYYQVLWTPPRGNAYYNLAHQYIAAKLNILNDADSTPAVDAAIAYAESLFAAKTPAEVSKFSKAQRAQVLAAASTLDQYNNGLIGPGHCDEDGASIMSSAGVLLGRGLYLPIVNQ